MLRIRLRGNSSCAAAVPVSSGFPVCTPEKKTSPSRNLLIYGYSVIFFLMPRAADLVLREVSV